MTEQLYTKDRIHLHLEEVLSKTETYKVYKSHIKLIDGQEFSKLKEMSERNRNTFEEGLGLSFPYPQDKRCYVAINLDQCLNFDLSFNEVIAVALHEYGHLLNDYVIPVGTTHVPFEVFKNPNLTLVNESVTDYKEYYADSFVTEDYKPALISALDKYFHNNSNDALLVKRKENIRNGNTVYSGSVSVSLKEFVI